jgi:hypothetical protein
VRGPGLTQSGLIGWVLHSGYHCVISAAGGGAAFQDAGVAQG